MTPDNFFVRIVEPSLQWLTTLPGVGIPIDDAARMMVMTIAGQESAWANRRQIGGPARGFWEFEGTSGATGEVFARTPNQLRMVCIGLDIPFVQGVVFEALAWNDPLACAMARLLLWQDPASLPPVGDKEGAWDYYLRNWRPGAPHHDSWSGLYDRALGAIHGAHA